MSLVDKSDTINCKSWMDIADCNYEYDYPEDNDIPPSGVVYCNIEHVTKLFEKCKRTNNKYVVVSGFSDFGLAYQKEHPTGASSVPRTGSSCQRPRQGAIVGASD